MEMDCRQLRFQNKGFQKEIFALLTPFSFPVTTSIKKEIPSAMFSILKAFIKFINIISLPPEGMLPLLIAMGENFVLFFDISLGIVSMLMLSSLLTGRKKINTI